MLKSHVLIDLTQPSKSKYLLCATNLEICVLCEVQTGRFAMPCLVKHPVGSGYTSLARDLLKFQELGQQIPAELDLDTLNDGNSTEAAAGQQATVAQDLSIKILSNIMLQQWRKLSEKLQQSDASEADTRSAHSHVESKEPVCFFCNKPGGSEDSMRHELKS